VDKLRNNFGLQNVVLVGDRGMLTQTQINKLGDYPGIGWISALTSDSIRTLINEDRLQLSIFDERNIAEISSPDFPGERLVACFNPHLAIERKRTRESLLKATEKKLDKIVKQVARRTQKPLTAAEIGKKVGSVINSHKVGKHFTTTIDDSLFTYTRNEDSIKRESELDGIYIIRTSEPEDRISTEDTVRRYKGLSMVEQAFRTLKSICLLVRPIRHRTTEHVMAHIQLCHYAYYVEWHMRKALAPYLFTDEQLHDTRMSRDPVAKAEPSEALKKKKSTKKTQDGFPVQSFSALMDNLGTICRNLCALESDPQAPTFLKDTEPSAFQKRIFDELLTYPVT
jgi:transposase